MFLNVIGSTSAIRSLAVLTVGKLGVLLLLVVSGIAYLGSDLLPNIQSDVPSVGEFGAAALLLIYAFVGFESAVIPAGKSRRPARDIPVALLLVLGGVALLYVLIQMVSMEAVPDIAASTSPLLDVANALIGPMGASVLILGVVASVGGNYLRGAFAAPPLVSCPRAGRQPAPMVRHRGGGSDASQLDLVLCVTGFCSCWQSTARSYGWLQQQWCHGCLCML